MKLPKPTTIILVLTVIGTAIEATRMALETRRRKP
jgi:hypothetical protein